MNTKKPRRHHFLPEFYQKYFADDNNMLWEFNRVQKVFSQKTPRGIGWIPHYYRYQGKDGEKKYDLETEFFQKIEDQTKHVIDKINKRNPLNDEDKETLAIFIAFQRTRVPDFQKTMDESTEKFAKDSAKRKFYSVEATKRILEDMDKKGIDSENKVTPEEMFRSVQDEEYTISSPREHSIKSMLEIGKDIPGLLLQMEWIFMLAPKGTSFITSDNPFFIIPPPNRDPNNFWDHGVGFLTPGAKKVIPLSRSTCLIIGDKGESVTGVHVGKDVVREINNQIARYSDTFIIAKDKNHLKRIVEDTKIDTWIRTERIKMG